MIASLRVLLILGFTEYIHTYEYPPWIINGMARTYTYQQQLPADDMYFVGHSRRPMGCMHACMI